MEYKRGMKSRLLTNEPVKVSMNANVRITWVEKKKNYFCSVTFKTNFTVLKTQGYATLVSLEKK